MIVSLKNFKILINSVDQLINCIYVSEEDWHNRKTPLIQNIQKVWELSEAEEWIDQTAWIPLSPEWVVR